MPLYPLFFLFVISSGTILSLSRGPIYGLITYVFIYFNIPSHQWWGVYLPEKRWSLIAAALLTLSSLLHLRKLGKIQFGFKSPATYLVLLLLLMCAITPFSYSPILAWEKVYDFFRYVYIYIFIVLIITDAKKYKMFLYSLFCFFLYLAYQAHFYFKGGRLDGVGLPDASDANMLAALILLIIPFLIQIILHGSKAEKLFSLFVLIPLANVFMMCGSRGGFVGLVVQILALIALQLKKEGLFKMLFVVSAVLACFFMLMDESYRNRLIGLKESAAEGSLEQNSAGRVEIWREGLGILKDYPFGAGGGGFMALSSTYLNENVIEGATGRRASHNTYLQVLTEQGVLGLLFYLSFIVTGLLNILESTSHSYRSRHKLSHVKFDSKEFFQTQNISLFSALLSFAVASFFVDRLYFEGVYLIAALVMPLVQMTKNDVIVLKYK